MSRRTTRLRRVMRQAQRAERGFGEILPQPNRAREDCHTRVKVWEKNELRFLSPRPGSRRSTHTMQNQKQDRWLKIWETLEKKGR